MGEGNLKEAERSVALICDGLTDANAGRFLTSSEGKERSHFKVE